MPTELPLRKTVPPASTTGGMLAFAIAVLLMLAISTAVLLGDQPAHDPTARTQNL